MILSVRDVLDLPVFATAGVEIVAGQDALEATVRWVHVSELLEVATLLTGGELLLSTGLMIGADSDAARQHLTLLERAGAAGVIVELPAGREPTQSALRRAAAGSRIPVVILHQQTRFVDITEAVHRLIVADQVEQLEANRRIHELFTDLALHGAAPDAVVRAAADLLAAEVLLEDPSGRVVALGSPPRGAPSPPRTQDTNVIVSLRGSAWGRLRVRGREDTTAHHVAERAAQAITLHLMAERDDSGLAALAQSTFLTDVISGDLTADEVDERAATLGLLVRGPIVPLAVHWPAPATPLEATQRERTLRDVLSTAARRAGASVLTGHVAPNALAVLLAAPMRADIAEIMDAVAVPISEAVKGVDEGGHPWIGVGPPARTVHEAASGLAEAAHVASSAASVHDRSRHWFRAADVRLPGLIAMLADDQRAQSFARAELSALLQPDRADDVALIRALVASGGSKAAAAQSLFLSRPALYHRIGRIERELGISLSAPESLLSLAVALMIADAAWGPDTPGRRAHR